MSVLVVAFPKIQHFFLHPFSLQLSMRTDSYLPNPCLLAIIITISTHKGPQFVLHYPPDPDNHGYQAAPTSAAKAANRTGEENDGPSSSTSQSDNSSSSGSYLSETDEVLLYDDSDGDIPRNYDNAKDELLGTPPFRRTSGASTFTGSLTSQASSSFNTKSNEILKRRHRKRKDDARKTKHNKRKSRLHRLTRSETNTLNPLHRKALTEAKLIEGIERARQSVAARNALDDDEDWLEGDFSSRQRRGSMAQNGRRRSSMSDLKEMTEMESSHRRRSSHNSQRPKKLNGAELLKGSAIDDKPTRKHRSKGSISPIRRDSVVPPDIQAWSGGISTEHGVSSVSANFASTASTGGGSSQGGSGAVGRSKVGETLAGDGHSSVQGGSNPRASNLSWETVLGFDTTFLSELLVPSRYLCNTRFELTVDDMAFLGAPVHVLPDGKWKKRKKPEVRVRSMHSTLQDPSGTSNLDTSLATLTLGGNANGNEALSPNSHHHDDDYADDEFEPRPNSEGNFDQAEEIDDSDTEFHENPTAGDEKQQNYTDPKSDMRMFHVVFVMNPPVVEYSHRIEEMYYYILSQFVRTLRYEQAKSNFVWKEVSKILEVRDRATQEGYSAIELWEEISQASSLAVAVSQLYDAVSASEIANLSINSKLRAFQIPIKTHFETLPEQTDRVFTGTYLSSPMQFEGKHDNEAMADLAILLLEEPEAIIRDIRIDVDEPLAVLIRSLSPMASINQLALMNRMDPATIVDLASNLIYWRRARIIYPISHRNIYIVSPLSPLGNLYHFATLFRSKFPMLPSLPRILSMLSTDKPTPYHRMIPSKDHRNVYLEALAWLLRYGFVTQLRTFLWLKITRRIKMLVKSDIQKEEDMREYELEKQRKEAASEATPNGDEAQPSPQRRTDYASNTAHHKPVSPTKVMVQAPDDELKFPKTAVISSSPSNVRSMLHSSFRPGIDIQQPIQSTLTGSGGNGGMSLTPSPPSNFLEKYQDRVISEHSTSDAIGVCKKSNFSTGFSNRLGTSLEGTAFLNPASASAPTYPNLHHSSSIVGSLSTKRGPISGTSYTSGMVGANTGTDRSVDDEAAVVLSEEWIDDSILLNPCSATALQLKWIAKIIENKPPDVITLFGKVLKYMDGEHAMESVLVEENITRQELRKLTKAIEDHIIIVRHW